MSFDSKCNFTPCTVLLGLLLCPCIWEVFPQSGSSTARLLPSVYHLAGASLPLDTEYLLMVLLTVGKKEESKLHCPSVSWRLE